MEVSLCLWLYSSNILHIAFEIPNQLIRKKCVFVVREKWIELEIKNINIYWRKSFLWECTIDWNQFGGALGENCLWYSFIFFIVFIVCHRKSISIKEGSYFERAQRGEKLRISHQINQSLFWFNLSIPYCLILNKWFNRIFGGAAEFSCYGY